jgi:hypothetical protein
MKKSNLVSIGLLALSVASCNNGAPKQKHPRYNSDSLAACNYYIREGEVQNYYMGVNDYPMWIYMDYYYSPQFGYVSRPGVVYNAYVGGVRTSRVGTHMTSGRTSFVRSSSSRSFSVSRSAVSRGGFGGHASSAS